jgi:ABC-type uncharacterized transport system substrate-binding protein
MRRIEIRVNELPRHAIIVAALVFSGCSIQAPQPDPIVHEPIVIIEPPPPVTEPDVSMPTLDPAQLPAVAIVLTSGQPAYADVARELTRHFENYEIYDLSNAERPPITVLRLINDSDSGAVVAIGLRAARSSIAMSNKPVVFSQVFNYRDHNLLKENSRGVAAIAPLDAQLAAWKQADPTITRVGAIIGEGHDGLIAEAELAAERYGVELRVQVTSSDQETLYFFKRMIREIDGFWLFPDNRILSRRALQQIMADAKRQNVSVLVPNESMLQIGGSISVSSVASDIAETITKLVLQIQAGNIDKIPPITPLSEIRVQTKDTIQVVER